MKLIRTEHLVLDNPPQDAYVLRMTSGAHSGRV